MRFAPRCWPSPWPGLWLKPENLQPIGAFKIRGAVTAISRLDPDVRARGVLAHSSGNHAQAVAYTARAFGIDAHIVIPDNASPRKVQATRDLGATVELVPLEQRFSRPAELAEQTGKALIPPFDHPDVIAGQGTVGLEISQDAADVAVVLVPVSGGGLISGVAAAITALLPHAKVIGVEPELAGDAAESLRTGRRTTWSPADTSRTMADGLRAFGVGELPWRHISTQVHDIITVSEDEIADATRRLILQATAGRRAQRRGRHGGVPASPGPAPGRSRGGRGQRRQHRPVRAADVDGRCLIRRVAPTIRTRHASWAR